MPAPTDPGRTDAANQDALLRRDLGFWSLLATGVGTVIASGWLFASLYAAQAAGPASLVSWVIAGVMMTLIALVYAELGMLWPESGGLVRYPLYSNGRFAAAVVGWAVWVSYVAAPTVEAAAAVQYASAYLPGVYAGTRLTPLGILLAAAFVAAFVVINYGGIRLYAITNNVMTAIKVVMPVLAVAALISSGFDTSHFGARYGGFAPYGWTAPLTAIAGAGVLLSYIGFRNVIELAGEARDPRRTIPRALITTMIVIFVVYAALQVAFLGTVPATQLIHGWHGVNLNSPFADLAVLLGLPWLSVALLADSAISPAGSALVFTAANARNSYALAKNRFFPRWLLQIHSRRAVPTRALVVNFVVGVAFLLPLPSWHAIIEVTSTLALFTYSIGPISLTAFRRAGITTRETRLPGMTVMAPVAFVIASLVIFWASWATLLRTIPIIAAGLLLYALSALRHQRRLRDIRAGVWLVAYFAVMYCLSAIGTFGGQHLVPAPWDTVTVAVISLLFFEWGVRAAQSYLHGSATIGQPTAATPPAP